MTPFVGIVAFCWPFVVAPGKLGSSLVAALMFGVLLFLARALILPLLCAFAVGLTLGPVSGRLIAEMVTGAVPFCDPAPYSAERFGS